MKADPVWVPILAFVFGGVVFIGLDAFTNYIQRRRQKANKEMLGLYTSVALDLLSDGIMVGTATVINPALGLLLAAGQVPADVPEGFATAASLRRTDINRSKRLLILASFALPVLIGAIVGYFALKNAPEIVTLSVLALTGGALVSVVLEEVLTESHKKDEESRYSVLFLVGGFALFAWVSAYFG